MCWLFPPEFAVVAMTGNAAYLLLALMVHRRWRHRDIKVFGELVVSKGNDEKAGGDEEAEEEEGVEESHAALALRLKLVCPLRTVERATSSLENSRSSICERVVHPVHPACQIVFHTL